MTKRIVRKRPPEDRKDKYVAGKELCPWCNSGDVYRHAAQPRVEFPYAIQNVMCQSCGAYWRDHFKLIGITWE